MKTGIELIAEERRRQIEEEGYTTHEDWARYDDSEELSYAASAYALPEKLKSFFITNNVHRSDFFPWKKEYWKPSPSDRIRELSKAGALIAAALDFEIKKKEQTKTN